MENHLISKLKRLVQEYRFDEKILVNPDFNTGYQILQHLARKSSGWINFKTATVESLAYAAAEEKLLKDKIEKISLVESNFLIDGIFSELSEMGRLKYFKKYIINTGIIGAITDIIIELKMSGVAPSRLKIGDFIDPEKAHDIKLIFSGYEDTLRDKGLTDTPNIIAAACKLLESGGVLQDKSTKYIVLQRYPNTFLEKEFLKKISGDGLIIIPEEKVHGLSIPRNKWAADDKDSSGPMSNIERSGWLFDIENSPPPINDNTIELFSGANSQNEIDEMLGRIAAEKIPIDKVEIIYTNSDSYLISIYNTCRKLGIAADFSEGLPGDLSLPGMALKGFLLWIEDDFAEIHLRKLLKYSLIKIQGSSRGPALAHKLRTSKIGWGKDRYGLVLNKEITVLKEKIKENGEERYKKQLEILEELSGITKKLIEIVPPGGSSGKVDFSVLCSACLKFLSGFVPAKDEEGAAYLSNLKQRLEVLARITEGVTALEEASGKLLNVISGLPFKRSGPRPGRLYISPLSTGGRSGRENTFIIGMDSHRFPGAQSQDPILLDEERQKISSDIRLSRDRLKEKLYDFTSMLASLRGRVTVSYGTYDIADDRQMFPSSAYLQIYRLKEGDGTIDYQKLLSSPGRPSGSGSSNIIDETGWWMEKLTGKGSLKDARESILNLYPPLRQGYKAIRERSGSALSVYDGFIDPEGSELDPRENRDLVLSCSAIETYAENPFAFFLEYILNARRPQEIKRDPSVWLDAAQRGSLLHEVFQLFTKKIIDSPEMPGKVKQREIINKILDAAVKKYTEEVPVPGNAVYSHEVEALRRDLEVFLDINSRLSRPHLLEYGFGYGGKEPVEISIGGGSRIRVAGKIDRVDIDSDGNYHVWDYKTGSAYSYNDSDYIVGGRQFQHILYAKVIEKITGKECKVARCGYILPTEKGVGSGKGSIFERDPGQNERWQQALSCILDLMSAGLFIISQEENPPYVDDTDIYGTKELKISIKNKINTSGSELLIKWKSLRDYK